MQFAYFFLIVKIINVLFFYIFHYSEIYKIHGKIF
jgi:hypothetical protein